MFSDHKLYHEDIEYIYSTIDWAEFSDKTFFITGATGLIGTVLIDSLMNANREKNAQIKTLALTRNIEKAERHFSMYQDDNRFCLIEGDVSKPINVPADAKIDYVINLASNTHPVLYATKPIETINSIVMGTKNILDLAVEKKVKRVINASSVEVYGENRGDVERFTEDYCGYINSNTLRAGYPEGKRLTEALSQAYISEHSIDVIQARLTRVYGPTVLHSDKKAATQFIFNAVENRDVILKSKGEQKFSYVYVADTITAILTLILNGSIGESYNIAHDEIKTLRELAGTIADINHKEVVFDIPSDIEQKGFSVVQCALVDSSKIKSLGWNAKYNLKDGMTRTVQILKANNDT